MAYTINKSKISSNNEQSIRAGLCLQPENSNNKYNRGNPPEPTIFYREEGEYFHLPYLYASALLQIIPNINIDYIHTGLKFTGSLRPNQVTVANEAWKQLQTYGTTT